MISRRSLFASLLALPMVRRIVPRQTTDLIDLESNAHPWDGAPTVCPDDITIYNPDPGVWVDLRPGERKPIGNGLIARISESGDSVIVEDA